MSGFLKNTIRTLLLATVALTGNVFSSEAQTKAPAKKAPAAKVIQAPAKKAVTVKEDTVYMKRTLPGQKQLRVKTECGSLLIIFNETGKAPATLKPKPPAVCPKPVVQKTPVVKKATPVVKKETPKKTTKKSTPTLIVKSSPAPTTPVDTAAKSTPVAVPVAKTPDSTLTKVPDTTAKVITPDTTAKKTPPVEIKKPTTTPTVEIKQPEKKYSKLSVVVTAGTIATKGTYDVTKTTTVPFHLQKPAGYTGPWSYPETVTTTEVEQKKFKSQFGLGLEYRFNQSFHAAAGFVQNALGKGSVYGNAGAETNGEKFLGVGGSVGGVTGYGGIKPTAEAYGRIGKRDALINGKIGFISPINTPTIKIPAQVQFQVRVKLFSHQKQYQNNR